MVETIIKINRVDMLSDAYAEVLKQLYVEHNDIADDVTEEYMEYATAYIAGSWTGLLVQWIKNNQRESPKELSQMVAQFYMPGSSQRISNAALHMHLP